MKKLGRWDLGGRGGIAAGLVITILLSYLLRDLGALVGLPVAAALVFSVVRGWPRLARKDKRVRLSALVAIVCAASALELLPIAGLMETWRQGKNLSSAKQTLGGLIEKGNAINGRWEHARQVNDVPTRESAENEINEWRKTAGAQLSTCPFTPTLWAHHVATQEYNLISIEIVRLHYILDHADQFVEPCCALAWPLTRLRNCSA